MDLSPCQPQPKAEMGYIQDLAHPQKLKLPIDIIAMFFAWLPPDHQPSFSSLCKKFYTLTHGAHVIPGTRLLHESGGITKSVFDSSSIVDKMLKLKIIQGLKSLECHRHHGFQGKLSPIPYSIDKSSDKKFSKNGFKIELLQSRFFDSFYAFWNTSPSFQIKEFNRINNHRENYKGIILLLLKKEYLFGGFAILKKICLYCRPDGYNTFKNVGMLSDSNYIIAVSDTNPIKVIEEVVNRSILAYTTRLAKYNLHILKHINRVEDMVSKLELNCTESGIIDTTSAPSSYKFSIELREKQLDKDTLVQGLFCEYVENGIKASDLLRWAVLERTTSLLMDRLNLPSADAKKLLSDSGL